MKYAGIKYNDIVDCDTGICVSFWTQGCPHRCAGCHNPQTWDFNTGEPIPVDITSRIIKAISANGISRDFSVLGGEPLCPENLPLVAEVCGAVRQAYPHIKICLWTGYTYEELQERKDETTNYILSLVDILIDGRYEEDKRDITLPLRGSSNQRIIDLHKKI